jgi:hypothetical protein
MLKNLPSGCFGGIWIADVAQSVERVLGKDEVMGSNPIISSMKVGKPEWPASNINGRKAAAQRAVLRRPYWRTSGHD